jgi:hypothetical protein
MDLKLILIATTCFFLFISSSHASEESAHLEGSVTYGFGPVNVLSPSTDLKINPAQVFSLNGEKSFSLLHLYLEAMFIYTKTTASVNYNYTTAVNYVATNANAGLDIYGAGFGLRFKILDHSAIRPFAEFGGLGNYMQFTYDSSIRTANNMSSGSDFKSLDAVLDFGTYVEGGFEIDVGRGSGIQIADRYLDSNSRPLATLKNQMIHYMANFYLFSVFSRF